jgi:RNA polymerase-binding protein DksA
MKTAKLNKSKLDHFKKLLLEKKADLERELTSVGKENPDTPGDWEATPEPRNELPSDPNEMADVFEELENRAAIEDTIEKHLADVKESLERIEEGTYGICSECEKAIKTKRLEAVPSADKCMECAEM